MPQVITGFDRFAQSVRQKKLDERTATLQDAQETRAASAFEMAKQDRVTANARQVKQDAQDADLNKLKMQEAELGLLREAITTELAIGGGQRSLDGPGQALRILLPEPEKFAEGSYYEPVFDEAGAPSGFRFYSQDGDTYFAGINDPEALAPAGKRIAAGEGVKFFAPQYGVDANGKPVTMRSNSAGETVVEDTPRGARPFSGVETPEKPLSPAEEAKISENAWATYFNTEFSMKLPTSAVDVEGFDKIDESPGKARIVIMKGLREARDTLARAQESGDQEKITAAQADVAGYITASNLLDEFSGSAKAAPANPAAPPKRNPNDVITGKKWTVPKE